MRYQSEEDQLQKLDQLVDQNYYFHEVPEPPRLCAADPVRIMRAQGDMPEL